MSNRQRPFRIVGLDGSNSLAHGLVSYVRFGQAESGLDYSVDWAQGTPAFIDLNAREIDATTGYLGSYAQSPNSNAFSYPARFRNGTTRGFTFFCIFQANSVPLDLTWRELRVGVDSDTTGLSWDHTNVNFRGGIFHQNTSGGYQAAQFTATPLNTWMFTVARWDRSNLELWVNGRLDATTSTNSSVEPFVGNIESAQSDASNGWKFATMAVWERPLSDKEIWRLYDPSTRWDFEAGAPKTQFIGRPGTGPPASTIPVLDEGHLTGGMQPLGGGLR